MPRSTQVQSKRMRGIWLLWAFSLVAGCGSVSSSPDGSTGGSSGGGAGAGGAIGAAGRGGNGGGAAGATGGAIGAAGRGGNGGGAAGATGGAVGAAGRGGNGGGAAGATGGAVGAAGRGGTGGAAAGTGGRGGTGGSAGAAGRGGTSGGTGGVGGGRVACQTDAQCQLFKCCNGVCVNTANDILNCGGCNRSCAGPDPYCASGTCGAAPCSTTGCAAGATCCGSQCCNAGQLCCLIEVGPSTLRCSDPVLGTCPQGCIGGCPCTAPTTPVATPAGSRAIADLRAGDLVYSVDRGAFVVVPIKLVHRTPVAPTHRMVEVKLAHGVILNITPDHPTADGRTFADLVPGDRLDGVRIDAVRVVPYGQAFTHDILPESDSGTYIAGGVLIGSALAAPVTGHATRASAGGRRASLPPPPRASAMQE